MTARRRVRVVVVEDSRLQREVLIGLLEAERSIKVVGQAGDVEEAVRVVGSLAPDVVTVDLELPGSHGATPGGIVAIEAIMAANVVPLLVLSAHVASRADTLAIDALAAGAVDCLPKDPTWSQASATALRRRVLVLSRLQMVTRTPSARRPRPAARRAPAGAGAVVALAASTGGPSALRTVLDGLVGAPAAILVVQHLHPDFTVSFATWLEETTGLPTHLGRDGEALQPGHVYLASGTVHLRLGPRRTVALSAKPALLSRPSCDELLHSVAAEAGPLGIGAVLTGMGDDGARGLLALRQRGGSTFAQDAASSTVDGMPRAARELGAAQSVLPIDALGAAVAAAARRVGAR